jgi:integrase
MIRELSKGRWEVVVYLGRHPETGKKRNLSRVVHGSRSEAKRLEARLLLSRDEATPDAAGRSPMHTVLAAWLEHAAPGLSPSTLTGYRGIVRRYLDPEIGEIPVGDLTPFRIDALYAALRARGTLSSTTIHHVHAVLHRALEQAVRWEWIERNPATRVDPPAMAPSEISPPSIDQVRELLDRARTTDPELGTLLRLAVAIGARRGELCGLRIDDVDVEAATITIRRSIVEDSAGIAHEKTTKTKRPRVCRVDPGTVDAVRTHLTRTKKLALECGTKVDKAGFLFSEDPRRRSPMPPKVVSRRYRRLLAGLPFHVRLHDLRHWHVTTLIAAGVAVPQVGGRVGHASNRMTLDVYSHFQEAADDRSAEVIGELLG